MAGQRSIVRLFSYTSIITTTILTIAVMVVFISSKYLDFDKNLKLIKQHYIEDQKERMKSRVELIIENIKYSKPSSANALKMKAGELQAEERYAREKVLRRVKTLSSGKKDNNYLFILEIGNLDNPDNFATTLAHPNRPALVNRKLTVNFRDDRGNKFLPAVVAQLKKKGEAFAEYWYQKPGVSKASLKTSYFFLYKNWNWVIGSGFYHDELEAMVAQRKRELLNSIKLELFLIALVFLVISLFAGYISRVISRKIKDEFNVFAQFFNQSARKNQPLDKKSLKLKEFIELANAANKMIADKNRSEQALRKSKEIAEAATQAKSEFLANMSHEIRTPMNAVIGMSDILAQTSLTDEQYEYLEIINTSANNLLVIINDILDFSKIEAGRLNIDCINFNVRDVIEGVADMVAPKAHKKNLELVTLIEPDIPVQLLGDSSRLHQIILNLANNAIKFTDRGEIVISAKIRSVDKSRSETYYSLIFKVKDTGIGISDEGQQQLFKTFSQLDATTTRKYGGTGLGLAISKKLTELMGGVIGVESEEDKGSTFWFTCRFEKVKDSDVKSPIWSPDFRELKVLIVDDNSTNRFILQKYLEVRDCVLEEAENARDALQLLLAAAEQNKPFDLALLDFQMPETSGAELAEQIKANDKINKTPLVLLSSSTAYKTHVELRQSGFAALMYKPIKQSQLFRGIASVMGVEPIQEVEDHIEPADIQKLKHAQENPLDILLVEDNIFNQKVAIFNLNKFNHRVELAENGRTAIEKFHSNHYDIILMDIQMPVMDGYEATAAIRKLEREKSRQTGLEIHTPIIAMTANAMREDVEQAEKAGMDAHLAKPFNSDKFIKVVHDIAYRDKDKK